MKKLITIIATILVFATASFADVIVTKTGSTIVGKIQGIEDGKIKIVTDFAGEIEVDQAQVEQLSTDEPIFVSIDGGTSFVGKVTGSKNGALKIATSTGVMATSVDKVEESWQPGTQSPAQVRHAAEIAKLKRRWGYQAALDLTGKSGNSESSGIGMSFRATLKGPEDKLEFFTRANFEETDGAKSADDARGGIDYSNKISNRWNWYVSSEFGRDVIKDTTPTSSYVRRSPSGPGSSKS